MCASLPRLLLSPTSTVTRRPAVSEVKVYLLHRSEIHSKPQITETVRETAQFSNMKPFPLLQVLLFVFSILRKVAWDYGRLALVTDADR